MCTYKDVELLLLFYFVFCLNRINTLATKPILLICSAGIKLISLVFAYGFFFTYKSQQRVPQHVMLVFLLYILMPELQSVSIIPWCVLCH